ncbi:hypothetical protein BKA70DRAFT_1326926 [Coprinopsis sp. MPI-PUGE-AT-0042]|nr:hypothetical protein BKA70DRAFT_1326926 [Coprinopsis sp. MPI-PUGE-AT-0042]
MPYSRDAQSGGVTPSVNAPPTVGPPAIRRTPLVELVTQLRVYGYLPLGSSLASEGPQHDDDTLDSSMLTPKKSRRRVHRKPVPALLDLSRSKPLIPEPCGSPSGSSPSSSTSSSPPKTLRRVKRIAVPSLLSSSAIESNSTPATRNGTTHPGAPTITLTIPTEETTVVLVPVPDDDYVKIKAPQSETGGMSGGKWTEHTHAMSRSHSRRRRKREAECEEEPKEADLGLIDQTVSLPQIPEEKLVDVDLGEMYKVDLGSQVDWPTDIIAPRRDNDTQELTQVVDGTDDNGFTPVEEVDSEEDEEGDYTFYQWSPKDGMFSPVEWDNSHGSQIDALPLAPAKIEALPRLTPKTVSYLPAPPRDYPEVEESFSLPLHNVETSVFDSKRPSPVHGMVSETPIISNPSLMLETAPFNTTHEVDDPDYDDEEGRPSASHHKLHEPRSWSPISSRLHQHLARSTSSSLWDSESSRRTRSLSDGAIPVTQGLVSKLVAQFEEKVSTTTALLARDPTTSTSSFSRHAEDAAEERRPLSAPPCVQPFAAGLPEAWTVARPSGSSDNDFTGNSADPDDMGTSRESVSDAEQRMREEEERMWEDEDAWIQGSVVGDSHDEMQEVHHGVHTEVEYDDFYGEEDQQDCTDNVSDDEEGELTVVWSAGYMAKLYRLPALIEESEDEDDDASNQLPARHGLDSMDDLHLVTELDGIPCPFPSPYRRELPSCCRSHLDRGCERWEVESAPGCIESVPFISKLMQQTPTVLLSCRKPQDVESPLSPSTTLSAVSPMTLTYSTLTPATTTTTLSTPGTTPGCSPQFIKQPELQEPILTDTPSKPARRSTANIPYDSQSCLLGRPTFPPSANTFLLDSLLFEPRLNEGRRVNYCKNEADGACVCEDLHWPIEGVKKWVMKVNEAVGKADEEEIFVEQAGEPKQDQDGSFHANPREEGKGQHENEDGQWLRRLGGREAARGRAKGGNGDGLPEVGANDPASAGGRRDAEDGGSDCEDGVTWLFDAPPSASSLHSACTGGDEKLERESISPDYHLDIEAVIRSNKRACQATDPGLDQLWQACVQEYDWETPNTLSNSPGCTPSRLRSPPTEHPLLLPFPTSSSGLSDGWSQNADMTRALNSRPPSFMSSAGMGTFNEDDFFQEGDLDVLDPSTFCSPPRRLPEPQSGVIMETLTARPTEARRKWWQLGSLLAPGSKRSKKTQGRTKTKIDIGWPLERSDIDEEPNIPQGPTHMESDLDPTLRESQGMAERASSLRKALRLVKRLTFG